MSFIVSRMGQQMQLLGMECQNLYLHTCVFQAWVNQP